MENVEVYSKTTQELLAAFGTSATAGLTPDQVERARARYGTNELPTEPPPSIFKLILEQFDDLLVKILLAAAVIDLGLAIVNGETGFTALIDPIVIGLILAANAAVGVATESNAAAAIAALREMEAESSRCLRGGALITLPVRELVPGDIIEVRVGDKAPADCYVMEIHGAALRVDQSIVTGESGSVDKVSGPINAPEGAVAQDKINLIFSGSLITSGSARCLVTGTGTTSAIGRIQDALVSTETAPTPLKRKLDEFGTFLSKAIATICVVVWLVNIPNFTAAAHGGSWLKGAVYYFQTAVALAVAAIPEGLPAVVTTCLALGTRRMAQQNAIVRTLPAVETLGCTTVICVDKTGTLTTNAMTVSRAAIVATSSHLREFTVATHTPPPAPGPARTSVPPTLIDVASGAPVESPADITALRVLATIGAVCNDAVLNHDAATGKFSHVGESMEGALCMFAERVGHTSQILGSPVEGLISDHLRQVHQRVATLEFDRDRKIMSVVATRGQQRVLFVKGAPESVMKRCTSVMGNGGALEPMNAAVQGTVDTMLQRWGREAALRCLALAYKELPAGQLTATHADEQQLLFLGLVGLHDPPRPEACKAVHACQEAGIRVIMLTGDNVATAEAVAMQVGILGEECEVGGLMHERGALLRNTSSHTSQSVVQTLSAAEFDKLGRDERREAAASLRVLARVEPSHKQHLVELLQEDGQVVAMTGDGVNDAPALRKADIGVAMGSGTAVARNSADIVLSDDNVQSIVSAVAEGRRVFANARQFIRYMVSSNIGEVVAIFAAAAGGLPAALSPVQLLWVNLVTDGLPATALSFNEAAADQMQRRPRSKDDGMVDQWMVARYAIIGTYVGAATAFGFVWWFLFFAGGPQMSWGALSTSAHCVDTPAATYQCSVFEDRGASTVAMSVLVVVEMFNALNAISENSSLLVIPPWQNLWLLGAILVSMLLHCAILYIPGLQAVFGVQELSWREWRAVLVLSVPVVLLDEFLKLVSRGAFRNTAVERAVVCCVKACRFFSLDTFKGKVFPPNTTSKLDSARTR